MIFGQSAFFYLRFVIFEEFTNDGNGGPRQRIKPMSFDSKKGATNQPWFVASFLLLYMELFFFHTDCF